VEYCRSKTLDQSIQDNQVAAEDIFRLNGDYYFGDCDGAVPYLNRAQKETGGTSAWIPLDDEIVLASEIVLSKSFFWPTGNPLYPAITLKIDLPSIQTDGFCLNNQTKSFRCMNQFESRLVEASFKRFENQKLYHELQYVSSTLEVVLSEMAKDNYEDHFSELRTFNDDDLAIQFDYPTVFGSPEYDPEAGQLIFPDDDNQIFQIQLQSLDQVEQALEVLQDCDGPCVQDQISKEMWESERNLIEGSSLEPVECTYGRDCQLIKQGDMTMLSRYFNQWPITDGFRKEYALYKDDLRYDIYIKSDTAYTGDLEEFKALETTDFTLQLLEKMVESIKVIQ